MHADIQTDARDCDRFSAAINVQKILFDDPVPDTRHILNAANYTPADERKGASVKGLQVGAVFGRFPQFPRAPRSDGKFGIDAALLSNEDSWTANPQSAWTKGTAICLQVSMH